MGSEPFGPVGWNSTQSLLTVNTERWVSYLWRALQSWCIFLPQCMPNPLKKHLNSEWNRILCAVRHLLAFKGWNQSHTFPVRIRSNRVFRGIWISKWIIYHFFPSNETLRQQNSIWLMIMDNKLAIFKSILTWHSSSHHRTEVRRGRIAHKHQSKQSQTQFELLFGQMSGCI